MAGGSKGQKAPSVSEPVVGVQPAYLQGTSPATMPAGMPGQIDALARQLSAAFGATPKAFYDSMNQVYKPAPTLDFTKAGTVPKPKPKVTDPKVNPKPTDARTYLGGRNAR